MPVTHATNAALEAGASKQAIHSQFSATWAADGSSSTGAGQADAATGSESDCCGHSELPESSTRLGNLTALLSFTASLYQVELYDEQEHRPVVLAAASDQEILNMLHASARGADKAPQGQQQQLVISREQMLAMRSVSRKAVLEAARVGVATVSSASLRGSTTSQAASPSLSALVDAMQNNLSTRGSHRDSGSETTLPGRAASKLSPFARLCFEPPEGPQEDDALSTADSELSAPCDDEEELQVVVGPTYLSVSPMQLSDIQLPDDVLGDTAVTIGSQEKVLCLSDCRRLGQVRKEAPVSFGSSKHVVFGPSKECRPCMFERWPGRCTKAWLCDFCHMHATKSFRKKDVTEKSVK